MGKTPSSSNMTAWWWWRSVAILQGFAKCKQDGEVLQGEREAPGAVVLLPSLPPHYI